MPRPSLPVRKTRRMPFARLHRCALPLVLTSLGLLMVPGARSQVQTSITTAKGRTTAPAVPHPPSWWTTNPLRLDSSGDLMVGRPHPTASPSRRPIIACDSRSRRLASSPAIASSMWSPPFVPGRAWWRLDGRRPTGLPFNGRACWFRQAPTAMAQAMARAPPPAPPMTTLRSTG